MKKINGKILCITCLVCLLPILFGIIFYEKMPEVMPIHFNIHNEADGFASKKFALFGIPIIMTVFQIVCCIISDIKENQNEKKPKFITIIKWIIPILSVIISMITIQISLGNIIDVRRSVMLILGILYIVLGNYMPKTSYEQMKGKMHPMPKDEKMYRKWMRVMGYTFVIFGLLFLISIAFDTIFSVIVIFAMVVVLFIEVVWMMIKSK